MRSERCRVVVKCRPCTAEEADDAVGNAGGITLPGDGRIVLGKEFEADHVYLPSDGDAVYQDEVQTLVGSLYEGINSTVFAYGASGSGKTHTVLGSKSTPGLVDRISDEVFGRYDQRTCTVSVSVEELYCERFTDLLAASAHPPAASGGSGSATPMSSSGSSSNLGPRGMHFRPNLHHQRHNSASASSAAAASKYSWQKVTLNSSSEMKSLVQHVLRKRHTASTCLNDKSSRSHVIVTITLEQRKAISEHKYADDDGSDAPQSSASSMVSTSTAAAAAASTPAASRTGSVSDLSSLTSRQQQDAASETRSVQEDASSEADSAAGVDTYLIGKLYLVDLAGSENIKRSGAEGTRQKEAGEINKSLCHLKTVIEEVYRGRRVTTYRNSKLTFRLQDALGGGNSKLLVVACISTAKSDMRETKETLLFAEMARRITNTPVVNREPKDELIHRLQLQVAELQDQLRTAKEQGGRAATEEVLQQLNVVEAAYADLQEDMEGKEAKWTAAAMEVQQQVVSLQQVLRDTQGREASTKQQLEAERATVQRLQQCLADEQTALQGSQQAGAAVAALLQSVQRDSSELQQHCEALQQQLTQQHAAAAAAVSMCAGQQEQAQDMQQELALLRQHLQQEREARAAAEAQVSSLQHQQQALQLAAQCAAESAQGMQALGLIVSSLQQQASAANAQQQAALQQHGAVAASLCASEAAQTVTQQQLAAAVVKIEQQQQQLSTLQQTLEQREVQHAAAVSEAAAAHATAAAQAAAEHLKQRQALEQQLQNACGSIAQLRAQLDDERSEHEALLSAERLRHEKQLAESMHSSVKKLTADKLRCREHLSLQMHSLRAEAQILSQALSSPNPMMPAAVAAAAAAGATGGDGSGAHAGAEGVDGSSEDLSSEALHAVDLQDLQQPGGQRRVSPVPGLLLEASDAVLSDTTAAPMQDASEQCLSGGETGDSEGCSSGSGSSICSPTNDNASPMGPAAQQAAIMAVATVAFSRAASSKGLTPRPGSVSVHVEAGGDSSGGGASAATAAAAAALGASAGYPAGTEGGHGSPSDRMMLPPCGSVSASPSLSSIDGGSQGGGSMHPAAAAAASAAAAAAAARARRSSPSSSSKEQQSRHRRRRREFTRSFSSGSWPISYLPKEEVDMVAAAAAFNQLRGGQLNVENLQRFLELRMLGGKLHTKTLSVGGKKRKHELIQDMLAYHRWHLGTLANCSSSSGGGATGRSISNAGSDISASIGTGQAASTGGATPTPRSSICSSPESGTLPVWHPLGRLSRPSSAAPSSATGSPAKPEMYLRYSCDGPAAAGAGAARNGGSGIGRYTLAESHVVAARAGSSTSSNRTQQERTAFDVEGATDAGRSRSLQQPQSDVAGAESKQGRWSWLTPRRRKQHSILAQLQQSSDAALLKQQQQGGSRAAYSPSPEPLTRSGNSNSFAAQLVAHASAGRKQSLGRYASSEGGGQESSDALSPRDKRPAATGASSRPASRAGSAGVGPTTTNPGTSNPNSQPATPSAASAFSLNGRTISAVTGSAVAEFYVDSPAVKVVPGGSRQRGGGSSGVGTDPMRLAVDLGSAHRSGWRQVQLTRK